MPAKVHSAKHVPQHQKGNRTKPFDLEGGIHYKTVHQHRVRGSSAPFRGLKPAFWPVGWADQSFYPACPHIGCPHGQGWKSRLCVQASPPLRRTCLAEDTVWRLFGKSSYFCNDVELERVQLYVECVVGEKLLLLQGGARSSA